MVAHYRGLGWVEGYDYQKAEDAFREVHSLAPRWIPGAINLAIALLYQRAGGDLSDRRSTAHEALTLLDEVIARDPKNLHAHFCRGLIFESYGPAEKARVEFQFVVENDPRDAHAWYSLGSTIEASKPGKSNPEEIAALKNALACNPYLITAVYRLAMAYRNAGDREAFSQQLDMYKRLNGGHDTVGPGDDISSSRYGGMGKYAQVIDPLAEKKPATSPIRPPRFEPPVALAVALAEGEHWVSKADFTGGLEVIGRARARFGASVAVFDADGDGLLDLYLAAAVAGPQGVRDALLLNRGAGKFEDATTSRGLPLDRTSLGVATGDFDADGLTDLFLTGIGDNRLYRNQGTSGFKDVSNEAGIAGPAALSLTARWIDLDQDGDLDLYIVNYTGTENIAIAFAGKTPPGLANSVYRNDGQPAPVPGRPSRDAAPHAVDRDPSLATSGLSIKLTPWSGADALLGGISAHTGLAWLDLDDDRDLDLVVSAEGAVPLAILNDRLGRFRGSPIKDLPPGAADAGLLVTDFDQDGRPDLAAVGRLHRLSAWKNNTRRESDEVAFAFAPWPNNASAWRSAYATDLDLDGWPDLVGLPAKKELPLPEWARNDGKRLAAGPIAVGPDESVTHSLEGITLADVVGDALPDLVMIKDGDAPRLARSLGNGHHWLSICLNGRWVNYGRLRSNPQGTGARIWLQGPWLSVMADVTTNDTGLNQSLLPITLGLGEKEEAAVLRLRWPDGVSQSEVDIRADRRLFVVEDSHRVSTCPILFTWNGQRYQCASDLLAGGGLGYYLAPGVYSEPDRDEAIAISAEQLKAADHTYRLVIAEPMDETAYLDHLTLDVVDRPPGVACVPDERFVAAGPGATGGLIAWKQANEPVRATDLAGRDLTEVLHAWDRRTADDFARLEGWNGYAEEHGIVLDFGDRLSRFGAGDHLTLCLAGWTEYPFSQTNYAASTAGIALEAAHPRTARRRR